MLLVRLRVRHHDGCDSPRTRRRGRRPARARAAGRRPPARPARPRLRRRGPRQLPRATRSRPTQTISGEFSTAQQGSYVLVPFDVPAGTTSVRVKYCYDQPEAPTSAQLRHTLDLGLYDARSAPGALFGESEFRGWGGSSHPDVTISPRGLLVARSSTSRTRRATCPGRPRAASSPARSRRGVGRRAGRGRRGRARRRATSTAGWRGASRSSSRAIPRTRTSRTSRRATTRARRSAGRAGTRATCTCTPSTPRSATPPCRRSSTTRSSRSQGGAGLDFITLSDYVTSSAWGEIGRYQGGFPGNLIARSVGDHHLPRPHEQPRERALRRLPHRARARAPGGRLAGGEARRAPAERAVRRACTAAGAGRR